MAKKKRYHHPDLKQALLDGALKLIQEEGLRGFSLRKLAMLAGVSHAAPYRHFASKEQLLVSLMLEGHKRLRSALLAAASSCKGTAVDKYLALGRAYLEFARENPEHLRVMFSREAMQAAMGSQEPEKFHQQDYDSFGVVEEMVRACQREGALPKKGNVGALGILAWAEVHGLALLCNEGVVATMAEMRGTSESQVMGMIFAFMEARLKRR